MQANQRRGQRRGAVKEAIERRSELCVNQAANVATLAHANRIVIRMPQSPRQAELIETQEASAETASPSGRVVRASVPERPKRRDLVIEAGLAIQEEDAFAAREVGYVCRALVQATLPYKEPKGSPPAWGRTAGKVSLVIQPGFYLEPRQIKVGTRTRIENVPVSLGYPYGSIPRLLLAWIGREVTLHKKREIVLGQSLAQFMNELGMTTATGGKNGSITRLRDQMRRTFSSKIAILDNPDQGAIDWKSDSFSLVDKTQIWWDESRRNPPGQSGLFESAIVLS